MHQRSRRAAWALAFPLLIGGTGPRSLQEISTGMSQFQVVDLVGQPSQSIEDRSFDSDWKWSYRDRGEVFLCDGTVTSVHVPIGDTLADWILAVHKEESERGPATFSVQTVVNVVEAKWTLRNGSILKFSAQDLSTRVDVSRWLLLRRHCKS
jgi:hypothetical protein